MYKKASSNYFKKNGKSLKLTGTSLVQFKNKETISSLFVTEDLPETVETIYSLNSAIVKKPTSSKLKALKQRVEIRANEASNYARVFFKHGIKPVSYTKAWVAASFVLFFLASLALVLYPNQIRPNIHDKYSIYAAKPLIMEYTNYSVYTKDSRAQRINEVFKQFNCPLEGMGEVFVYEADKNNIPWWLVAAVAFQESSCGKLTPEKDGVESFNAWGWGVYGDNVHMFENWVRGIETVSRYMSKNFYSKGITEPCDIMRTYTPPSKGSWCEGVKYFGDIFENYKTPNI